jgi:hypothetical protein
MRIRGVASIAVLTLISLCAAGVTGAATAESPVFLPGPPDDPSAHSIEPTTFAPFGSAAFYADHLEWSSWGGATARAEGVIHERAEGRRVAIPGRLVLGAIVICGGNRYYAYFRAALDNPDPYERMAVEGSTNPPCLIPPSDRACGKLKSHYREKGTSQYVLITRIRADNLGCRHARSVARAYAAHSHRRVPGSRFVRNRHPKRVRGYGCLRIRLGSDVANVQCRRGKRLVAFGWHDSSPFH